MRLDKCELIMLTGRKTFKTKLMKTKAGIDYIADERNRQFFDEAQITYEKDDTYTKGQLVDAAICYAESDMGLIGITKNWPWDRKWWKPTNRIRDLSKAGALIASEIDRLVRIQEREAKINAARAVLADEEARLAKLKSR